MDLECLLGEIDEMFRIVKRGVHLLVEENEKEQVSEEDTFVLLFHSDAILHAIKRFRDMLDIEKAGGLNEGRIRHPFPYEERELVLDV